MPWALRCQQRPSLLSSGPRTADGSGSAQAAGYLVRSKDCEMGSRSGPRGEDVRFQRSNSGSYVRPRQTYEGGRNEVAQTWNAQFSGIM